VDQPDNRHFYYQWTSTPQKFPIVKANFYGTVRPSVPRLFVTDLPKSAMASRDLDGNYSAVNASLEFRMCLYREKDVPKEIIDGKILSAEPLVCSHWRNSYVYDFEKQAFDSPEEIAPQCVGPLPKKPH
jgi:hypothetical protein